MRDLETIEAAITAAETATSCSAPCTRTGAQGTVNRIIDVFPTNQQEQIRTQLSTSIIGILSQGLCHESRAARRRLRNARGHAAIANLIRENKTFRIKLAIQTGAKLGMHCSTTTVPVYRDGIVTKEEALIKSYSPDDLGNRISRSERGLADEEDTSRGAAG